MKGGWVRAVSSHKLVPGDVIVVQKGKAMCDMVLLQGSCLVVESMLSGEVWRQCCAVLCCAAKCCAVVAVPIKQRLCCLSVRLAMLCCAVLSCPVLCCAVLCCGAL